MDAVTAMSNWPDKIFYFYAKLSVLCFESCHWLFQPDTKPAENHLRMLHCMGFLCV